MEEKKGVEFEEGPDGIEFPTSFLTQSAHNFISEMTVSEGLAVDEVNLSFRKGCNIEESKGAPNDQFPSVSTVLSVGAGRSASNRIRFNENVLLDMPVSREKELGQCNKSEREDWVIDAIRHRLDLPLWKVVEAKTSAVYENQASADDFFSVTSFQVSTPKAQVVDSLLMCYSDILEKSDLPSREYLLSAMLDRRRAVPLFLPGRCNPLISMISALSLTRTTTSDGNLECIVKNVSLMRVALVSLHTAASSTRKSHRLLKTLLSVESLADECLQNTLFEVGFGFLKNTQGSVNIQRTVVVFHLIGCYDEFKSQILPLVDVVIFEYPNCQKPNRPEQETEGPRFPSLVLNVFPDDLFKHQSLLVELNNINIQYHNIFGHVDSEIVSDFVWQCLDGEYRLFQSKNAHQNCLLTSNLFKGECYFETPQFSCVHLIELKDLRLQQLFKLEAEQERSALCKGEFESTHSDQLKQQMLDVIKTSPENLPIFQMFLSIVSKAIQDDRIASFIAFDQMLSVSCSKAVAPTRSLLTEVRLNLDEARRKGEDTSGILKRQHNLVKELSNKLVAPEHLWREVGYMYTLMERDRKDPELNLYHRFPKLAAIHLMDGFSIEICDGDASQVNDIWVQAVMQALQTELDSKTPSTQPTRVFVLSILGLQKSGKSTLLNIMFGCRLRTGIERCTKGIHMQLVRSQRSQNYEYVLVLDVEGVRSGELYLESDKVKSVTHDNRLGLFAVWAPDATIVLLAGTQAHSVNEILSMIAHISERAGSDVSKPFGSSRLFFAMRSIAQGSKEELDNVRFTFEANIRKAFEGQTRSSYTLLHNFLPEHDIRLLGNSLLSVGGPPNDVPVHEYGVAVKQLRSRIDEVCGHKIYRSLTEWANWVGAVRSEVLAVELHLNGQDASDVNNRQVVDNQVAGWRQQFGRVKTLAFDELEEKFYALASEFAENEQDKAVIIDHQRWRNILSNKLIERMNEKLLPQKSGIMNAFQDFFETHTQYSYLRCVHYQPLVDFLHHEMQQVSRGVEELVYARQFYEIEVESVRMKITEYLTQEIQKIPPNERTKWPTDSRNAFFDYVFVVFYNECVSKHPRESHLTVHKIRHVFELRQRPVSLEHSQDIPEAQSQDGLLLGLLKGFWNKITSITPRFGNKREESQYNVSIKYFEKAYTEAAKKVSIMLETCTRYDASIVESALAIMEQAMAESQGAGMLYKYKEIAYINIYKLLVVTMTKKMEEWENENCASALLLRAKEELRNYFHMQFQGVKKSIQLTTIVINHIDTHIQEAFKMGVIKRTLHFLREQEECAHELTGFVRSAHVLQAYADKDLLLCEDDSSKLFSKLQNPANHYLSVLKTQLAHSITNVFSSETWPEFKSLLKEYICNAAEKANVSPDNKALKFFHELHKNLPIELQTDLAKPQAAGQMFENLPRVSVEEISEHIEALPPPYSPLPANPDYDSLNDVERQVVNSLYEHYRKLGETLFRPRCMEVCPLCKCICYHQDGSNHPGDHWSCHQPMGMAGIMYSGIGTLFEKSCYTHAMTFNALFEVGTTIYKFAELKEKYPPCKDWKNITPGDAHIQLKVREYLFFSAPGRIGKNSQGRKA